MLNLPGIAFFSFLGDDWFPGNKVPLCVVFSSTGKWFQLVVSPFQVLIGSVVGAFILSLAELNEKPISHHGKTLLLGDS